MVDDKNGTSSIMLMSCDADDPRLAPLLQEYLREWSALVAVPVVNGRFVYEDLAVVERVLFVADDGDVAFGFAFTSRDESGRMHVEEFFIAPHARRSGLGTRAAHALFASAPGAWTFTVRPENPTGLAFWRRACADAVVTLEPGADGIVRTRFTFAR